MQASSSELKYSCAPCLLAISITSMAPGMDWLWALYADSSSSQKSAGTLLAHQLASRLDLEHHMYKDSSSDVPT